jgi:hypothetical protein
MSNIFSSIFLGLFLFGSASYAENPPFEVMCRQKAKELAAESYRGCITENRKVQIEQLKNDYQQRLRSLKDEYDGEIKKMSGASTSTAPVSTATVAPTTAPVAPVKKSRRASRSSPRTLPTKTTSVEEMTVRLRSSTHDDSTMDIPEPIPVESVNSDSESNY